MAWARTPKRLLFSVWPLPLSLATTKGISVDVFSSPYLDVSVQAVPLIYLFDSVYDAWIWLHADFSIRKSAGRSSLTAHRSLSQLTTSFIGSQCQGIHPALMFALPFAFLKAFFRFQLILFSDLYAKLFRFLWLANFVVFTRLQFSSNASSAFCFIDVVVYTQKTCFFAYYT